jgi:hypothetical protein
MENSFVSWRDYEGIEGFGAASANDVADLRKALTAGQDVNDPGAAPGVGFPLRIESLERTLKVVTYRMDDVRLWRNISKLPAYNTVEEYNRLRQFGQVDGNAFIAEGNLPESDDSEYSREFTIIKYLGTTRSVTHVMSLVRPAHGPVISQEVVNGTAHLLKQIEKSLFFGDSALVPVQWDGLNKLITAGAPAANIIDLRGGPLTEDNLNDGALTVKTAPNYGRPTDLYCADGAYSDLAKSFYQGERFNIPTAGWQDGMVGLSIKGFHSMVGPIMFNPDVFIDFGGPANAAALGDAAKRPGTPTEDAVPTAGAGTPATNQFTAAWAGDYYYSVVAINRFGKSAPLALTGPVTVAAGQQVAFSIGDGSPVATAYEIYRSDKDGAAATAKLMRTVARTADPTVIVDENADLPGTSTAFLIQQNLEFFSFKQLCPFVRIPLATVDTSIRWMQLLYGAPTCYAPGKSVVYRNVGRAPGSVGGGGA